MHSLSDDHMRLLRLRAQLLTPQPLEAAAGVAYVVKHMCGIQAQDTAAAALAVRVRSSGLVAATVEEARVRERTVIRTWGIRGTLHLLATEDLPWLLPLLGPVFIAGDRRRREELGLDEDTCRRGMRGIRDILARQGPLTRPELVAQLAARGLLLEGQARPHLLGLAALEGLICFGPERGAEPTYVLLDDWVDLGRREQVVSEDAAYAELTCRYLAAYGPATPQDQAAWSGLPLSKTRSAWRRVADQLMEIEVAGASAWMLKAHAARLAELAAPAVLARLLPRFDVYLLGYDKRDLALPRQHAKRVNAGGGMVNSTLLVDGRIVGTWKSTRKQNHMTVMVEPFDQLPPGMYQELESENTDLARFLGGTSTLCVMPGPGD